MNLTVVLGIINLLLVAALICIEFVKLPKVKQIENIKEWLKYAVTVAEKEFGTGTGQLKLRQVYEKAIEEFPWLANTVKFETFAGWVDEALAWMKDQLDKNKNIEQFVQE